MSSAIGSRNEHEVGIDCGHSLPFSWYRDSALYEKELSAIFEHTWQYAGSVDRAAEPGSFFTAWIARTPVVVIRQQDRSLRAFANVCPHRGHAVALGDGCRTTLQCRYHGWTFNLDGRLRKAPRTEADPTFVASEVGLRELSVATWGPLVFVSPSPRFGFESATEGLRGAAERRAFDVHTRTRRASRHYELQCNWKVTLDNNTECYHCATVHHDFAHDYYVDRKHYLMKGFEHAFTHESSMRRTDNEGPAPDFHLYYLWPNFMLSARRTEYFYTYHYRPISPTRTLQLNDYFFPDEWSQEQIDDEIDRIAVIMKEDADAFASVQEGMNSGALERGIVLPNEEEQLCHFQRMHARWLDAEEGVEFNGG